MEGYIFTKRDFVFFVASVIAAVVGISSPELMVAIRNGVNSASLTFSHERQEIEAIKAENDLIKKQLEEKEAQLATHQKAVDDQKASLDDKSKEIASLKAKSEQVLQKAYDDTLKMLTDAKLQALEFVNKAKQEMQAESDKLSKERQELERLEKESKKKSALLDEKKDQAYALQVKLESELSEVQKLRDRLAVELAQQDDVRTNITKDRKQVDQEVKVLKDLCSAMERHIRMYDQSGDGWDQVAGPRIRELYPTLLKQYSKCKSIPTNLVDFDLKVTLSDTEKTFKMAQQRFLEFTLAQKN